MLLQNFPVFTVFTLSSHTKVLASKKCACFKRQSYLFASFKILFQTFIKNGFLLTYHFIHSAPEKGLYCKVKYRQFCSLLFRFVYFLSFPPSGSLCPYFFNTDCIYHSLGFILSAYDTAREVSFLPIVHLSCIKRSICAPLITEIFSTCILRFSANVSGVQIIKTAKFLQLLAALRDTKL